MRNKEFFLNSIKMDLYRVAVAAGNITQKFPVESVKEFLLHIDKDFKKIIVVGDLVVLYVEVGGV